MASNWVPFSLSWDDAPIDLSFIFESETPAGRHGFLSPRDDQMIFDDGTVARFWGTLLNGGANFPSHEESAAISRRLAKFGVNLVRMHQLDAEWSTPNIFQFNRAVPKLDTRSFDPESMDRLDYLVHCLKLRGIYIYLDLLTHRRFLPGDEVDAVESLTDGARPYIYFDSRLIELQKEFNSNLWTHVNAYDNVAYKDDPAIALTLLAAESDFFSQPAVLDPFRSRLEHRFAEWAGQRRIGMRSTPVDFAKPDAVLAEFLGDVQRTYYAEMIGHLRTIGVRVPVAGTNWSQTFAVLESQAVTDFTDTHWYWNFPHWEDADTGQDPVRPNSSAGWARRSGVPMVGSVENVFIAGAFQRLPRRPMFVGEWDQPWPDEWRAESPLINAAIAALQGWTGMAVHTYRYATHGPIDRIGGGASTINGVTYRNHFDTFNDPALFGLFYHAALILRRGDVRPAVSQVLVDIPANLEGWRLKRASDIPALKLIAEVHRVAVALPGESVDGNAILAHDRPSVDSEASELISDTGEIGRNWEKRIGWIDTPRTKVAYGFLGRAGRLDLGDVEFEISSDFATVAISSLTDEPIAESRFMLLTAIGRCDNSDAQYDDRRMRQIDPGRAPVLIEAIEASLAIPTSFPALKVWVIGQHGEAVTRLPTDYVGGKLRFSIGAQPRWNQSTMYYLIRP